MSYELNFERMFIRLRQLPDEDATVVWLALLILASVLVMWALRASKSDYARQWVCEWRFCRAKELTVLSEADRGAWALRRRRAELELEDLDFDHVALADPSPADVRKMQRLPQWSDARTPVFRMEQT